MANVGTVNIVEDVSAKTAALPEAAQREVLDFVEFLLRKTARNGDNKPIAPTPETPLKQIQPPVRSVLGSLEHLGVHITDEDIAEVRREMWANFPREEPR
ncbi:MAG: hypothetical protein JMDDDDMK_05579 [Acidobacteria bacterium]|nr:hypothetical protein [Acidobacteriota bacterium]